MTPLALALAAVLLTPPDAPRWDAAGQLAWLAGTQRSSPVEFRDWFNAATIGATAGFYVSPHLKVEGAVDSSTRGTFYTTERLSLPGSPFPIFVSSQHAVAERTVSALATYQFFENTWVHPFVSGGAELARADDRIVTLPESPTTSVTTTAVRPTIGGGAKFYVSPRAFVRTDARWTFDTRGVARVTWRGGIGFDF